MQANKVTSILYLIIVMLFVSGAGLAVAYQLGYLHALNSGMPFLEPDNYEYYLFAQLAISHPGLQPLELKVKTKFERSIIIKYNSNS